MKFTMLEHEAVAPDYGLSRLATFEQRAKPGLALLVTKRT